MSVNHNITVGGDRSCVAPDVDTAAAAATAVATGVMTIIGTKQYIALVTLNDALAMMMAFKSSMICAAS